MSVRARVLGKFKTAYGIEIYIRYACPLCDEDITETITFDEAICSSTVKLVEQECPACGACDDVEIDFDRMNFGDAKVICEKDNVHLLEIGCSNDRISYAVSGNGSTEQYDDLADALEEFNRRWMYIYYGEFDS